MYIFCICSVHFLKGAASFKPLPLYFSIGCSAILVRMQSIRSGQETRSMDQVREMVAYVPWEFLYSEAF